MRGYLANGLFSQADRMFNEFIAETLREDIEDLDLYLPQENFGINDKNAYADSKMIANGDNEKLLNSDFLIAVIDGVEIDSGVACEIGVATILDVPTFALYTDTRQLGRDNQKKINALIKDATESQFFYRNLYVIGNIKNSGGGIYSSIADVVEAIKEYFQI